MSLGNRSAPLKPFGIDGCKLSQENLRKKPWEYQSSATGRTESLRKPTANRWRPPRTRGEGSTFKQTICHQKESEDTTNKNKLAQTKIDQTSYEGTQCEASYSETTSIEETRVQAVALRFKKLTSAGGIKPNYTGAEIDSNLIYMFDSQTVAIGVGKGWSILINSVSTSDLNWNRCLRITSVLYHIVNNEVILNVFRKYLADECLLEKTQSLLQEWSEIHPQSYEQIAAIIKKLGIEMPQQQHPRSNGSDVQLLIDEDDNNYDKGNTTTGSSTQKEVSNVRHSLIEIDPVVNLTTMSVDLL